MASYNINIGVNAYQAARGISQIRTNLNQLNIAADRSRNLLSNLFVTPLLGIYTMQAALTNVISTMATFSRSMAEVRAITGATERQVQQLENEFVRLGRTTRFTASQAAQAGVFLARAGFEAQTIRDVSEATLELALATGVQTPRAADIATNVLTAFRLEVEELGDVFDQLTFVTARTNTDLLALSEALKFIAPAAESANIPLNQVIAALGILAQAGIRGSIAGTGLRRVISRLASETPIIEKRLATLGLTFEDVNLRGGNLIGVFETLIRNGVDLGDAFALFGDRGGPAFEAIADRIPEFIRLSKETEDATGFTAQLARIMGDNLLDALIRVGSAAEAIILAFRRFGVETILTNILDAITRQLRAIAADVTNFANLLQSLGIALGAVFGNFLLRNLIPALAALAGITPVFRAITVSITAFGGILTGILTRNVLASLKVFGGSILAIGAALIGSVQRALFIVTPLIIGFSDRISILNSNITTLRDFLLELANAIFRAFSGTTNQIASLGDALTDITTNFREFIGSERFLRGVVRVTDLLLRGLLASIEAIQILFDPNNLRTALDSITRYIQGLFDRAIILPILRLIETVQRFNPFDTEREQQIRQSLISDLENFSASDEAFRALRRNSENFVRLNELLNEPILNLDEILEAANARARSRIIEFTEAQNRLAAQTIPTRAPLGPDPEVIPIDVRQQRSFEAYLNTQREEFRLLGLNNRERRIRNEILEAQEELEFELNATQRERLRNLIVESQVQNALNEFRSNLERQNEVLQADTASREVRVRILELERDLYRELTDVERRNIETIVLQNIALEKQVEILDNLRTPILDYTQSIQALEVLLANNTITLEEFNREVENLQLILAEDNFSRAGATFIDGFILGIQRIRNELQNLEAQIGLNLVESIYRAGDSFAEVAGRAILHATDWESALRQIARTFVTEIITSLIRVGVQLGLNAILGRTLGATATATSIGQAALLSTAWATPAALASLASFGANAAPANAAILSTLTSTKALAAIAAFQEGGLVRGPGTGTSDSILARLSRGEFVVNAEATRRNRDELEAINRGESRGSNITLNFNIQTPDANSFRRSETQILGRASTALRRAVENGA